MSTREERKTELRQRRLTRERETQSREQRRRRLGLLGASTLAALLLVGALIAVSQNGGTSAGGGGLGQGASLTGASAVTRLFEGIPQRGAEIGNPRAPLRMVEFVDLQCPFCAEYSRNVLPTLIKRYVRPGKLSIELRPLTFIGDDSRVAGQAAAAAAARDRAWQFVDLFYLNQGQENSGYVTTDFLSRLARATGLSPGPLLAAAQSTGAVPLLDQAEQEASQHRINSTPSFLLGRRGQALSALRVSRLQTAEFTSRIDAALGG
jgi:protein-disulfide isomerase